MGAEVSTTDDGDARRAAGRLLDRLGLAQTAIRESGPEEVLAVAVTHLRDLVEAGLVAVVVADGAGIRVRAHETGDDEAGPTPRPSPEVIAVEHADLVRSVLRSGRPGRVACPGGAEALAVPVVVDGSSEAAVLVAAPATRPLDDTDLQLARLCAHAAAERVLQLRNGSIEHLLQLDEGPPWLQPLTDPLTGHVGSKAAAHDQRPGRADRRAAQRAVQHLGGPGWATWHPATGEVQWSAQMHRHVGLESTAPPLSPADFLRLVHPDDRRDVVEAVRAALRGVPQTLQFRGRRPDGVVRTLHAWVDARRDRADATPVLRSACLDVTDQVVAQRALAEAETALVHAMDQAPYGMVVIGTTGSSRGMVLRANLAFCDLLGRPSHEVAGPLAEALPVLGADGSQSALSIDEVERACAASQRLVRRLRTAAGNDLNVWLNVTEVGSGSARGPYLLVHVLDVTAQTHQQRALERLALHDPVTGLGNRSLLNVRLDRALAVAGRGPLALMMIDLDRFKTINDSLGHHVGDLLLQEVGSRLQRVAPGSALVARQGGDEFVLLWDAAPDEAAACRLAQDVVDSLCRPYQLRTGHMVVSSVSIGVAVADPDDEDIDREDLARKADLAMYRSKALGGNGFAVCDQGMLETADRRLDSESRLRRAIENNRLRVFLQPIVDLADRAVTGVEALLRLDDPEQGMLAPDQFIRVAEESGLIVDVDLWVLDRALRLLGTAGALPGPEGTRLSVNVSCRTLERPGLCRRIERLADGHGADIRLLTIEITESSLLADSPAVQDALAGLQEMGVRLAIDDFGTGYSALAYLQRFNLDVLKIDQSFVHRLATEPERARITLGAIITLAHAHGLAVVAEGVETEGQARVLRDLGCDLGQGWLYGAAVPPLASVLST